MLPSTRRRLLSADAGGTAASLAGCLGPDACVSWSDLDLGGERGLALRRATDDAVVEWFP